MLKARTKERLLKLLRATAGALSCYLLILLTLYLDSKDQYRDSIVIFSILMALIVTSAIYSFTQLISMSDNLSKIFITLAVSKGPGRFRARRDALRIWNVEKKHGSRVNQLADTLFVTAMVVGGLIVWSLGKDFVEKNVAWLVSSIFVMLLIYFVAKTTKDP